VRFILQVRQSSLLSGRNVRWPRRICPLVSGDRVTVSMRTGQRQTDGRKTVTLRSPLDADNVIIHSMII